MNGKKSSVGWGWGVKTVDEVSGYIKSKPKCMHFCCKDVGGKGIGIRYRIKN